MRNILFVVALLSFSVPIKAQIVNQDISETRVYAVKDGEDLYLDIYNPEIAADDAKPVIVIMHGGGFSSGSPRNESIVKLAKVANEKGYIAVSISYRLTRKGQSFSCGFEAAGKIETFQKSAEDFMDAVSYLVKYSDELNIDPSKIVVAGSSAGAEAVLNAVYNKLLMFDDVSRYSDINIAAVLSLAGAIVDARYITKQSAIPAVFFHGTRDKLVPYGSAPHHYCAESDPGYIFLDGSRTIADKLKELNSSYLLFTYEGAGHEISGVQFEQLNQTFDFLDRILAGEKNIQIEITK